MRQLELRPVATVAVLRAVVLATPTVTLLLALTRVGFWRMLIGSAIGILVPISLVALFVPRVLAWLGG